jgi:hypothetical protein
MLRDPTSQTAHVFGVGMWNKQPSVTLEPWHQAAAASGIDSNATNGRAFYQELLLLASGIQMAGPNLTPESFAAGLRATQFPNPGAGTAPSYQGTVGFQDGDVVMVDDYAAFWLDIRMNGQDVATQQGINEEKAMCYVDLGRRNDRDSWGTQERFYQGGCR